jgi:hypothetical protein
MVSARGGEVGGAGRAIGADGEGVRNDKIAVGVGVAVVEIAGDAADSWNVEREASGGKSGGGFAQGGRREDGGFGKADAGRAGLRN